MKRMIAVTIALGLWTNAATAYAKPIYLSCDLGKDGKPFAVNLMIDEDQSIATVSVVSTGYTERLPATFTADEVIFRNRLMQYSLSRVTMAIARTVPLLQETTVGKCALQQVQRRAF